MRLQVGKSLIARIGVGISIVAPVVAGTVVVVALAVFIAGVLSFWRHCCELSIRFKRDVQWQFPRKKRCR